ncbi:uncharacterized protein LOC122959119 [Acropora millepora]|uniref:uncharacterized protein LOC122959119 n=1 Tax=Acropora millepora TaxID=45264 RepID=UPI001CF54A2A|nr:uncharacterized protein LOC122959119 [Acropora millepora]
MARFWLCAVTILSMCNLMNCDVFGSLCSCYVKNNLNVTDCQGRGLNTTLLLNRSFPKSTEILYLHANKISQLPETIFSSLTNLKVLPKVPVSSCYRKRYHLDKPATLYPYRSEKHLVCSTRMVFHI